MIKTARSRETTADLLKIKISPVSSLERRGTHKPTNFADSPYFPLAY